MHKLRRSPFLKIVAVAVAVVAVAGMALAVTGRLLTGQWMGVRSLLRYTVNAVAATLNRPAVQNSGDAPFSNVVFLHHSTGNNLIEEGGLRGLLAQQGIALWDHGYNDQGLRDGSGRFTGYGYSVPADNTDPDGLARIFAQRAYNLPVNTLSALLQHDVIIIKSCFDPANHILSDEQLQTYKAWYLGMRDAMDRHPQRLFIVMTIPPLNATATNAQEAARARALADWLASAEFLAGHPNVATFDLFGSLAERSSSARDFNMLRAAYSNGSDSHPNRLANETVAPVFAGYIMHVTSAYRMQLTGSY